MTADGPVQWSFFSFYNPEQPAGCFRVETHAEASPLTYKKSLKTPIGRLQARSTGQVHCNHGESRTPLMTADGPVQWSFFSFYDPEQPAGCFRVETHAEASPLTYKKSLKTPIGRLQARSTGRCTATMEKVEVSSVEAWGL
ncbi:hypothetical protein NDU88_003879 [Pleurodeles waltl]|uniref:Uncharacterized protein n=1 Tax=Pleurodeles waltl TaxID=8319 RepID=A0AAV7KYP2_PLEWA|nr:hypothetical protein NDU88_003879 [Pleurodeles waltl]